MLIKRCQGYKSLGKNYVLVKLLKENVNLAENVCGKVRHTNTHTHTHTHYPP